MRKIREILWLRYDAGLSYRGVAQSLNVGYGTVVDYLQRADRAGVNWPLPAELAERELALLLFPSQPVTGQRRFAEPDLPGFFENLVAEGWLRQLQSQQQKVDENDRFGLLLKNGREVGAVTVSPLEHSK